jgi:hypothetical protein
MELLCLHTGISFLFDRNWQRVHGFIKVGGKMPHGRFAASFDSPSVDVIVDLGNPVLNYTLDGFIKVGQLNF